MESLYSDRYTIGIVIGVVFGIVTRLSLLQTDYRQYPTYPHGRIIHISLGVIAAGLGAVAVPSLFDKNYTAITFLSLAAQQFRDVRNMERNTLGKIDEMELVPRGGTYIEGTAMVFEGRNYMVIFAAFMASLFTILFGWMYGIAAGIGAGAVALIFKSGKSITAAAKVRNAEIRMDGPDLYVDDIYIMNVGLRQDQTLILEHGMGLIVTPCNRNGRITIANLGQRQAMLHDLSTILGVYRDSGEPALVPLSKLDLNDGRLAVFILPQERNPGLAKQVLERVPLLESAVRMPSEAKADMRKAGSS
ncbi:YIEGIA family protein [Paenibacillus koleovorans]|uniref:YIEGIA family protein n=1 Tax=Paenibacillus koleovorans TaxID=121608 RepID=UPI000FDAA31C|nr:YIEGIA family protein [Paenibacillus koleovorans]